MSEDVVVLTGAAGTLPDLAGALARHSIAVRERPLLTFDSPESWAPVDQAIDHLGHYDVVALTSPRAAEAFSRRLVSRRGTLRVAGVWASGSATAAAWPSSLGAVQLPLENPEASGAGALLARSILAAGSPRSVLFPCGDHRREELPALLRAAGTEVTEIVCYRTRMADPLTVQTAVRDAALVVVTSPSVAQLLCRACPAPPRPMIVAIGATTAATLCHEGWPPIETARAPTTAALLEALWPRLRLPNVS